jgi:hypothetical protein
VAYLILWSVLDPAPATTKSSLRLILWVVGAASISLAAADLLYGGAQNALLKRQHGLLIRERKPLLLDAKPAQRVFLLLGLHLLRGLYAAQVVPEDVGILEFR